MASGKNALKNNNIIKCEHKKHTTMLVMLLGMLYLRSNKPNASKFPLENLKILSAKMISFASLP